tara:strand:- start:392 stop:931 length:540 start_codon:yes stop_codon:yes gene_type:complete
MEEIDFLNPNKTYFYKGFKITPPSYWIKEFLNAVNQLSSERRALLFLNQTNAELLFKTKAFRNVKSFRFEKNGRGMYWRITKPEGSENAWGLDVFNPDHGGINATDFVRAIPTYMNLIYQFKDFFKCKKMRAIVLRDNDQSIRMCQILVEKNYLKVEAQLKKDIYINGKDRDLVYFNVV